MTVKHDVGRQVAQRVDRAVIRPLLKGLPDPSRIRLRRFAARAAREGTGKDFRVLDAGAGGAPYRSLFRHVSYETADFRQLPHKKYGPLDHICDLTAIPVPDATYDLVLCTQVMEHMPEPLAVLRELHRVLKPGGKTYLSAPLFYAEHEAPYDFYRYTQFAWKQMAAEVGFAIEELAWLEGYYGTLAYQASMAAKSLPPRWLVWRILLALLARQMTHAEMKHKIRAGMPKNYRVIMVR
ncbi:MAG TPA: class I SAM-dependent methyltransferase [Propionibacteriaceae bacterium]|nr:class I SAM-dependent methyltransferase [Propionibacteriaceae bacterium]